MARHIDEELLCEKKAAAAHYNFSEWARLLDVAPRTLHNRCKRVLLCSPQKVLDRYRLEASKPLLLKYLPIKEVAERLWYKQDSHFCRQFKEHYHMTPSEFVEQQAALQKLAVQDNRLPPQITTNI